MVKRESHFSTHMGCEMGALSLVLPFNDEAFSFPLLYRRVLFLEKTCKGM